MANPRHAERDSNESLHETSRRAADQASQTSRTMSDAAERTARPGSEAFRRNAETVSSTWRNSGEAASRIAERSVDQFSKLFGLTGETARETMQQSASNVQALIESSTFVVDGLQNVSGDWMRFVQPHRGKSRAFRRAPGLPHSARMHRTANPLGARQYRGAVAQRPPRSRNVDQTRRCCSEENERHGPRAALIDSSPARTGFGLIGAVCRRSNSFADDAF